MNISRLRGFLLMHPKPHSVRVTGEGEPELIKVGKSYAKLAETIVALNVDLVEALDAEGKVLRATRLSAVESHRSDAAELPQVLQNDPQAALLTHFGNLLHRAYEHSTEIAFSKMIELVDKMNDRSDSIEQRLERTEAANRRLLQDQVDDAFDRAEEQVAQAQAGQGDLGQQIMGGFFQGQLQGKQPKVANGKG